MYFTYIIQSQKDHKYYTGITNNLERRLKEHNTGKSSTKYTLNRGPFSLVYAQESSSRIEARELEKFFKSGAGREIRSELLK